MLRKHNDKLNNESYSIGISKHVPNESVNLAFLASPEITEDNISIVKETIGIDAKGEYNERDDLYYAKDGSSLIAEVSNQDVLITDEFSLKKYSDEVPEPLFYRATLKKMMSGDRLLTNNKFVPYQYGYSLKTEDVIKADNTSSSKTDITPLIYRETYENGYNNILNITCEDGTAVLSGFKIRMTKQEGNNYSVEIYNNFDQDKIYKVSYTDSLGVPTTEVIESTLLFTKVSYDDFTSKLGTDEYWMAREYAIKQGNKTYEIYAPTQMASITDENRKPFEFKYRVFGNLEGNYSKSDPACVKVGMVFLSGGSTEDGHSLLVAFNQAVGSISPEYISFINPHPPLEYAPQHAEYKQAQDYWDVDLTAPQEYLNDYDVIFITGYGSHDLSEYNDKFIRYLNAGGKIVIDNLSNDQAEMLNIDFGMLEPILRYQMAEPLQTFPREFGTVSGYMSRHYAMDNTMVPNIGYLDGLNLVSPKLTLVSEDSGVWQDIIKFNTGGRSIAQKTFNSRGKIILSNCGVLRGFCLGMNVEAKKFAVNMLLTLAEDIWKVTPWIYGRVYHKNQLYKHEYSLDSYVTDINPLGGNQIVAKKILSSKVKDQVSYYTGIYGLTGKYFVEAYERDSSGNFIPLTNIYLPASRTEDSPLTGNAALYAFARSTSNTSFNVTSVQGYEESNIYPYSTPVTFDVVITPYTFKWVNDSGKIKQIKILPDERNMAKIRFTINKDEGSVNLGLLSTMIPQLPSGPEWLDKSMIFFKVEVSGKDDVNGRFVNPSENRVNLHIYDKFTGQYIYSSDSDNIIPYSALHEYRVVQKYDGRTIEKQRYEDIILQASTTNYELVASKRAYAIIDNATQSNAISLPSGLNTNESWYPRLKYMRFSKNSFDKSDYDRISKTIGFRFDKDYILQKAQEYFGSDPQDDKVADVIAKISGDEVVDAEDMAVIAEAFDLMDEEVLYEYDMVEYFDQAWDEYPYKNVKDEYAQYVNASTIKVQYAPMNVVMGVSVEGEGLTQVTPTIYESQNENWLPSKHIAIEMETEASGVWEVITSGYTIDYPNGILVFDSAPPRSIRASYSYSNLKVIRKTYTNATANMEELKKLSDRVYIAKNMINKRILRTPNPKVYVRYDDGSISMLHQKWYTIDYDTGIITMNGAQSGTIYMTYSYANIEYIEVKDYDAKHGIIELSLNIHFNDNVYVSYSYKEDCYEYTGYFDEDYVDPITNVVGKYIHIDLNPTRGHVCTYPTVESGKVVYREIPTYRLLGKTLYLYMLPHKITRGNSVTEENTTIRHTFSISDLALMQIAHPELMVLGSMKLMNNYTVYDVTTLDTRKRGGGLKDSISTEQMEKTDELSLNLWDVVPFDGRSYRPNGITIIKLPKSILVENGGKFTQDDVAAAVENHIALGVMPIIKYY